MENNKNYKALWLVTEGEYVVLKMELNGKWVTLIEERLDGPISHIIEPVGIETAIKEQPNSTMISQQTKERIAKEAEATRAEGLVKALEALNKQLDYYWNTSRAVSSRASMPETIKRGICAAQKDCTEALNNYNKTDK